MTRYLWLAAYLAVLVALLWPSSRGGNAVLSVTGNVGNLFRQAAGQVTGGTA
jgi:hypothetical protein